MDIDCNHFRCIELRSPLFEMDIYLVDSNDLNVLYDRWKMDFEGKLPRAKSFCLDIPGVDKSSGVEVVREACIMVLNMAHPTGAPGVGVMVHECTHIAGFILASRGVLADWDNDEPMAYMTEWLSGHAYDFYFGSGRDGKTLYGWDMLVKGLDLDKSRFLSALDKALDEVLVFDDNQDHQDCKLDIMDNLLKDIDKGR